MAKPASGTALNTGGTYYGSLTHVWALLEGSGGTTADSKGSVTGTLSNGAWSTDALGDACWSTSASDIHIQLGSDVALSSDGSASWSVAFRAKQTTANTDGMCAGNAAGAVSGFIWIKDGNTFRFRASDGTDYDFSLSTTTTEQNFLLVYDQPGAKVHLYVEGAEVGTGLTVTSNHAAFAIGQLMSGYGLFGAFSLLGKMSYFYTFSTALTSGDASTLHSDPYSIFGGGGGGGGLSIPVVMNQYRQRWR